jgi:predicted RNA-binding protein with PUA-like domain
MAYWLMKSEPSVFGLHDLERAPDRRTHWDGVRNYQARNWLRDVFRPGDLAFLYHSNAAATGVAAIMEVMSEGYPDPSAFLSDDPHHDPKSDPANPTWYCVDLQLVRPLTRLIGLAEIKQNPQLASMLLVRPGNRLSVMPVTAEEWAAVLAMEQA